ncbi:MAG: Na+/H+ antiporter subunit E [Akkermansiaceae bacterium]
MKKSSPISWMIAAINLSLFYIKEVVMSNVRVAYEVLTPAVHMNPALITVNISGLTDRQIIATSNLITMTPGTLSLGITEDLQQLTIHSMYVDDPSEAALDIENNYIRRIRDVF